MEQNDDLFIEMANDFQVDANYLINLYNTNNYSMILKHNNTPIGILIMEDIYYEKISNFCRFIRYIWIKKIYRGNHFGSKTIINLIKLPHLINNSLTDIVLNVAKNNTVNNFYNKLGFTHFLDNEDHDVLIYKQYL
jgi:hypothetical protein